MVTATRPEVWKDKYLVNAKSQTVSRKIIQRKEERQEKVLKPTDFTEWDIRFNEV